MVEENQEQIEQEAVEVGSAPDTVLEGLVRENQTLKTWVAGILEGCEGCTTDAKKWAEAMGVSSHEG